MSITHFKTVAGAALIAMSIAAPAHSQARAARVPSPGSIVVRAGAREVILSSADLAALPRRETRVVAEGSSDSVTVSGVALWDILQKIGQPPAEASGRQRVVLYVRLAGADGQNAVMALVEIDPGFSRRPAIVVDRRNGQPLDAVEGPWRVIVPDDLRHARWIRGLITVEVASVVAPPARQP